MSEEQARRVGLNESLFRQVNEQIKSLNHGLDSHQQALTVICECADGDCTDRIEIAAVEYEQVRSHPRRYIVVPGHELPEFESVVKNEERYDVVQKRSGEAAELAEETDPRS
jgi:DNA polymerase III sliding clamp (beta) subunit (PCNA family)